MSRFVRPDVVTLPLSEGDTITVKKRLTHGETREMTARMSREALPDGSISNQSMWMSKTLAYLLDWTLKDDSGKVFAIRGEPLDVAVAALDALDEDDFTEIRLAIEQHERQVRAEREQEKKLRAGAKVDSPISPSPDAAAGVSSG